MTQTPPTVPSAPSPATSASPAREIPDPEVQRLRGQAARDQRAQKWLGISAALSALLFLFLFYVPSRATLQSLQARIGTDGRKLVQDARSVEVLPQVVSAVDHLSDQLADFKPVPKDARLYEFTETVTDLSQPLGLKSFQCTPKAAYTDGGLGVWPIRLTFTADSFSTASLLREIESMPRTLRIHELVMRKPAAARGDVSDSNQIDVSMTVNLYFENAEDAG